MPRSSEDQYMSLPTFPSPRSLAAALLAALCLAAVLFATPALAQESSDDGDDERVEQLESELAKIRAQMEALRAEVEAQKAEAAEKDAPAPEAAEDTAGEDDETTDRLAEIESQIEILAEEIERQKVGPGVFRKAEKSEYGLGVAASKVYQVESGLSIGGYGEAIYEDPEEGTAEADFLRAIVYFGYKFTDKWVFNSEIEFEHASTSKSGSASVEFAYLDYLHKPQFNFRAGLVLVPMGFLNELHEPTLFLTARRPDIESKIIPSTWRENGVGLFGDVGGFSYRTYLVNGLKGASFDSGGLRGGRQKGSNALAEDIAWVGRIDYTGTPGFLVGASAYVGDSGQDLADASGDVELGTTILEAHLQYEARGFELRLMGVKAELDDVVRANQALGFSGASSLGEELEGWYAELGYDLFSQRGGEKALIPFARWETYDTQADVPRGFARNPARDVDVLTLGVAYQPIDPLIFKLDYQDYDNGAGTGVDQVNAAIGYLF